MADSGKQTKVPDVHCRARRHYATGSVSSSATASRTSMRDGDRGMRTAAGRLRHGHHAGNPPNLGSLPHHLVQVGPERFWIGSGCDQRVNYDVTADQDGGCTELQTFTRNFQPGYVEERPANQRVCLCTGQLCNGQSMLTSSSSCLLLGLAWILPRIFGLLRY